MSNIIAGQTIYANDISLLGNPQGRLSLSSSDPAPVADITAAGTLYYLPFRGNRVPLWDNASGKWRNYSIPSAGISASLSGKSSNYHVFLYYNGSSLALDVSKAWVGSLTITNATNASPIVITIGASYSLGSSVFTAYIHGVGGNSAANRACFAKQTGATTFALYADAAATIPISGSGAYTSGGYVNFTYPTSEFVGVDGHVTSASLTASGYANIFLGDIAYNGTSGQFNDARAFRGISNFYNAIERPIYADCWIAGASAHTYTTASYRLWNNNSTAGRSYCNAILTANHALAQQPRAGGVISGQGAFTASGAGTQTGNLLMTADSQLFQGFSRLILDSNILMTISSAAAGSIHASSSPSTIAQAGFGGYHAFQIYELGSATSITYDKALLSGWVLG